MAKGVRSRTKPREYDESRKAATLETLKKMITNLRRQKEHAEGKPITAYELHKKTGISINTIKKHKEIHDFLLKEKNPGVELKSASVKTEKIYTLPQAIAVINQLENLYNGLKDRYNVAMKENTALNLKIVKLQDQLQDLNKVVANNARS